ncbi:MAG: FHA domain-containing protein [Oligoflexia bacterium]|nr:FHA domain-containing protein [Oligoflexia bacterium]
MFIKILVMSGPRKDDEFVIKDETLIGRSTGDLALRDQKASNPHAKIFSPSIGIIEVEDLGSSNGILVNNVKVEKIALKAGDTITIGKTELLIKELGVTAQPAALSSPEIDKGTWQETVDAVLAVASDILEKKGPVVTRIAVFNPPFNLEFIEGIQVGTSLTYGFGPRLIGAHCVEGLLFEPSAPPIAFALLPNKDGSAQFKSRHDTVLLNGKSVKNQKLQDGDRISVGQTIIVFRDNKET